MKRIIYPIIFSFSLYYYAFSADIKFIKKVEIPFDKSKEGILLKIVDVKADKKGNIFVLDRGDNRIKKFSRKGDFIKSGGGKGEGPGELRVPSCISLDEGGNVYIVEIVGRRLLEFDNELNFIRQIKLPTPRGGCVDVFVHSEMFICCDDVVFVGDKYFYIFSKDGKLINSFFEKTHKYAPRVKSYSEIIQNAGTFFYFLSRACFRNGKIAFTYMRPENPYTVYIMNLDGKVIQMLQNEIRNYNPKEYYNFVKNYDPRKNRGKKKIDFDQFTIQGLHFTNDEFLIVQICKTTKEGENEYFLDIYTPDGKLLFNHYSFRERIFSVDDGNNVYTLAEDGDSIRKYKLILTR